jgi:hypothetical protein
MLCGRKSARALICIKRPDVYATRRHTRLTARSQPQALD